MYLTKITICFYAVDIFVNISEINVTCKSSTFPYRRCV